MMINTKEWKDFKYKDVFELRKGKRLTKDNMVKGIIPFIGATEMNNGITEYVDTAIFPKNSISVSYNGSVAEAFYHTYEYWGSDDIHCLTINNQMLDKYLAIYLCSIIKLEKYRFNYGRKWNMERMLDSIIKLPINTQGNPDWDYMREFIKQTMNQSSPKVKQALEHRNELEKPVLTQDTPIFDTSKWKSFKIGELFDISLGKPLHENNAITGETPYITRSGLNNGLSGYMQADEEYLSDDNVITIGAEGAIAFYQPVSFLTGNKINNIKQDKMNKYNAMFIISVLNHLMNGRFNYGYAIVNSRLKELSVKLPVDSQGNPDWDYMENYIKTLKYSSSI